MIAFVLAQLDAVTNTRSRADRVPHNAPRQRRWGITDVPYWDTQ